MNRVTRALVEGIKNMAPKRTRHSLTENDKNIIWSVNNFRNLVKQCGTWEDYVDDRLETTTVRVFQDLSVHLAPTEHAALKEAWSELRHSGDQALIDNACYYIIERVQSGDEPNN